MFQLFDVSAFPSADLCLSATVITLDESIAAK